MRRRGITLIELMTALVIGVFVVFGLSIAFSSAVRYQTEVAPRRQAVLQEFAIENQLRALIENAYIDNSLDSAHTFFIGRNDPSGSSALGSGEAATELMFTVAGSHLPGGALASVGDTFEDRNERLGPVGGVTERRIGLTPIGDAGNLTGAFLRHQTPSDDDPEQGGYESLLDERITSLSFEFWDGLDWQPDWDTETGERRLPAAVRITYTLAEDEDTFRTFVVRVLGSDITASNPLGTTAGGPTP